MSVYLKKLIEGGENSQLDFKYEISDSRKIAKSLSAFSNTEGGRLLLGVKDNGSIAGVRTEEEYYMLEKAVLSYCKPEIIFSLKEWKIDKKTVLEVLIPSGRKKPYLALDEADKWLAYIRVNDQNLLANTVLLKYWKREKFESDTFIKYTDKEKFLLDYLTDNKKITLEEFVLYAGIKRQKAENILVNFLCMKIIGIHITEKEFYFSLVDL
ncbi:MAG: ATP-binding protein [Bacteroidales bacterium]|nr:ATP-binding protein [Bacteroidales bacterium]